MPIAVKPELPVLIIGGGPAGLTLAQGLRKRGIPFRVFERDQRHGCRTQGWAVALQWITPRLQAHVPDDLPPLRTVSHLYDLGLDSEFAEFDKNGKEIARVQEGDKFLRADRTKLRSWLANHIDVEWNRRFVRYEEKEDRVTAFFEDGSSVDGCILVGAEGGRSRVRAQLVPDDELRLPNFDSLGGTLEMPKTEYLELCKTLGRSVSVIQADTVFMFTGLHRFDEEGQTAHLYWMLTQPQEFHDASIPQAKRPIELIHEQAVEWSRQLPRCFQCWVDRTKPEDFSAWDNFTRIWDPLDHEVATKRVTLMGDAAHKVTPLGGGGVNHAMEDALDLCDQFDSNEEIVVALDNYSKIIQKRGHEAVVRSTKWPVMESSFDAVEQEAAVRSRDRF